MINSYSVNTAIFTLLAVVPCATHGALSDDLVAYYSFDDGSGDTLTEQTGFGSDGDLFNFSFTDDSNWTDGIIGGALSFDGVDDHVIAPEYPLAEDALTVSLWAYANSRPTWGSLVKNWGQSQPGQFHFGLGEGAADTLNVFITMDPDNFQSSGTSPEELELEEWQHVGFVADPDEMAVSLYLNGEVVDVVSYDGTLTGSPNSEALGIGVKTNDAGTAADGGACCPGYWDGLLDDLGIWTRALSENEMAQIYSQGLAGQPILGGGNNLPGDFDGNDLLDAVDIDLLSEAVREGNNPPKFDLTDDGAVNQQDRFHWIEDLKRTYVGDSDLNGVFDDQDFVSVFINGKYLTGADAGWADGDWDGSHRFDDQDFVTAFISGGYLEPPRPVAAVPEPNAVGLALGALVAAFRFRR